MTENLLTVNHPGDLLVSLASDCTPITCSWLLSDSGCPLLIFWWCLLGSNKPKEGETKANGSAKRPPHGISSPQGLRHPYRSWEANGSTIDAERFQRPTFDSHINSRVSLEKVADANEHHQPTKNHILGKVKAHQQANVVYIHFTRPAPQPP